MLNRATVVVFVMAALSSCGTSSDVRREESKERVDLGAPKQLEPKEPGLLHVGPAGITLVPGEEVALWARLFGSDGTSLPAPSVTWNSSDADVIELSGEKVRALSPGEAWIDADDGVHAPRGLRIVVLEEEPEAGPFGIQFDAAEYRVKVGERIQPTFTVTDRLGRELPGASIELRVTGTPAAIEDVSLVGLTPGIAFLSAVDSAGNTLDGSAMVLVDPKDQPRYPPCTEPEDLPIDFCVVDYYPARFSKPGLTDQVELIVFRRGPMIAGRNCQSQATTIEAPDRIIAKHGGVVRINQAGLIEAVAPGKTTLEYQLDGVVCGEHDVQVGVDLQGEWMVQCENGDTGGLTISNWFNKVDRRRGHCLEGCAPRMGGNNARFFRGNSCLSDKRETQLCSKDMNFGNSGWSVSCKGACTGDKTDTGWFGIEDCGWDRHNCSGCEKLVFGPDRLRFGSCEMQRGPSPCGGGGSCQALERCLDRCSTNTGEDECSYYGCPMDPSCVSACDASATETAIEHWTEISKCLPDCLERCGWPSDPERCPAENFDSCVELICSESAISDCFPGGW